jgi:hypothetical protein
MNGVDIFSRADGLRRLPAGQSPDCERSQQLAKTGY